ncbi:hypothetical protein EK904_013551 [Melospiza melodia maxima]|nr:hypothetical protein EK904_013551 [Melospiza melodia maxima]
MESINDLDVNPTQAHRCQPRLWLRKHGIWDKIHIHIPKFGHVVGGTQKKQGKDSRTSEMENLLWC